MATSHPVIRGGPLFVVLSLLVGSASTSVFARTAAQRYMIHGSLQPSAAKRSPDSAPMRMSARLLARTHGPGLQSGGGLVVIAKLAQAPLGCADDTIFVDGFELSI
jgi:hypothetical protein